MKVSNAEGRALLAKQPKKKKNEESQIQQALVCWFQRIYPEYEELFAAIPNGGKRNIITASILKREGVRAGFPDLLLAVPKNGFNGLFIELKTDTGIASAKQRNTIAKLREQGYAAFVCKGLDAAKDRITWYLERE